MTAPAQPIARPWRRLVVTTPVAVDLRALERAVARVERLARRQYHGAALWEVFHTASASEVAE